MASEYQQHCREYVSDALARPEMFFKDLDELEALLHGHGYAFIQLGLVECSDATFNAAFGRWLRGRYGLSLSSGWAYALQKEAEDKSIQPLVLLAENLRIFWDEW